MSDIIIGGKWMGKSCDDIDCTIRKNTNGLGTDMNNVKVGSMWVNKDDETEVVEIRGINNNLVLMSYVGHESKVSGSRSVEMLLQDFKPQKPTIAVGDVWKHKIEIDYYVRVSMVANGEVFYVTEDSGSKRVDNADQFLTFYSLHESADPVIAVDSVWRCKEDGELVYIESDDGTSCWNLNFSPLGETDMYADDTKGFLSKYEFVCDSKYDSSLAFNAPAVAPDTANETLKPTKAVELLETSAATLIRCGKKYDSTGNNSERVMDRIVDMFNAATGHELTEAQGNIFMVCLKVVRSETSTYHDDDHYIDGVNYFAMAGEASSKNYKGGV